MRSGMPPFATFALLFMVATFLEHAEAWRHQTYTIGLLALILLLTVRGINRRGFLLFLIVATGQFFWIEFPEVANHANLILYLNLMLGVTIVASLVRRNPVSNDEWLRSVRPLLQLTLMLTYGIARFHKLNHDFLDPGVPRTFTATP